VFALTRFYLWIQRTNHRKRGDMNLCPKSPKAAVHISTALALFHLVLGTFMSTGSAEAQAPIRILALGDSLTAGYSLQPSQSFPAQLQKALEAKGYAVDVINAGVSGDTTAAALERFEWAVPGQIDAAIVELGANDALRGLDPAAERRNLDSIISRLKAKGIPVLLAGMLAPRNLGTSYVRQFDSIYPELAKRHGVILYPFFLDGVAMHPELNLADGLHPTARGVGEIVRRILPSVEQLIAEVRARRGESRS
jgi:acyl-CoA thioesterase I